MFEFEREGAAAADKARAAAIEHASLYTIFITDPRAQQLLALWKDAAKRVVPTNATLQEYVAQTKMREWVQLIEDNIELAKRPPDLPDFLA